MIAAWVRRSFLNHLNNEKLIEHQQQQAMIRIAFGSLVFFYIYMHAPDFQAHVTLYVYSFVAYLLLQIYVLFDVKRVPLSLPRFALVGLCDPCLIGAMILVDGGQFSPLYLFYLSYIMSSGVRFGRSVLLSAQILSLATFLIACFYLSLYHDVALDFLVLTLQVFTLFVFPVYVRQATTMTDQAVRAKQEAESMSLKLLDISPVAIFTFQLDSEDNICLDYANSALMNMTHMRAEQMVGYPIQEVFSKENAGELEKACRVVVQHTDRSPSCYIRTQHKEQQWQFLGNVCSFHFHKRELGICFLTDITQQQSMTMKMQKNMQETYMSTLVAGIVHDFRNVLTNMMGTAEMMQFEQTDPKAIQQLETVIQSGEQGSRMISNLLTLGKASQKEQYEEVRNISEALHSMIDLLRIQLSTSVQLSLEIPDELPRIAISLSQLEQVLINLIKNSAHACVDGGEVQLLMINNQHMQPPHVAVQVSDNGIGIPKEHLDKVMQPFWTSRKDSGGTGLGLPMVKRLVVQNHGHFNIQSQVNQGTCVTLTFPIRESTAQNMPVALGSDVSDAEPVEEEHEIPSRRVLLVDDNEDVLLVHQHMLERMGQTVLLATSAEQALSIMDEQKVDVLVTDYMMPVMDGITLCRKVRQDDAVLPIIMITAFGDDENLRETVELNVNLLFKPLSYYEFEEAMYQLIVKAS